MQASAGADSGRAESALWMFAVVAALLGAFLLVVILLMIVRRSRLLKGRKPGRPPHADVWRESGWRHTRQQAALDPDADREKGGLGPAPDEDHNGEHEEDDDDLQR